MKTPHLLPAIAVAMLSVTATHAADQLKVLIIDGQNNHDWKASTPVLQWILDVTFARGTEWAATGKVTLPVPKAADFATDKVVERKPPAR